MVNRWIKLVFKPPENKSKYRAALYLMANGKVMYIVYDFKKSLHFYIL